MSPERDIALVLTQRPLRETLLRIKCFTEAQSMMQRFDINEQFDLFKRKFQIEKMGPVQHREMHNAFCAALSQLTMMMKDSQVDLADLQHQLMLFWQARIKAQRKDKDNNGQDSQPGAGGKIISL